MKRLLAALDVDARQWRVLVRAFLKMDFAGLGRAAGPRQSGAVFALVFTALVYLLSGAVPATVLGVSADLLLGAAVMTTTVGFMTLSSLFIGDALDIISAADHAVLGFRPVTSRTYLAVRVTTMAIRTAVTVSFISLPSVLVLLFKGGIHVRRAIGGVTAAHATGVAVTLAVVATYGWLLRSVGPARLMRVMSYAQLAANTLVWVGFFLMTQGLVGELARNATLGSNASLLVFPGIWFASAVPVVAGEADWRAWTGLALTAATFVMLVRAIGGKLSLEYAAALGRLSTAAAPVATPSGSRRLFGWLGNETRAVAILTRSQFRDDVKFRLGLLALIPTTVIYMVIGLRGGSLVDPFVRPSSGGDVGFIQLALMFVPMTLRQVMSTSDGYRASWLFYATPADRAKLVIAGRNIIAIFFLVPYLALLAGVFAYLFGNVRHALIHTFFLGLMSFLVLQASITIDPRLPFATPPQKTTRGGALFGFQIVAMVAGMMTSAVLTRVVYRSSTRLLAAAAIAIALAWLLERLTRHRIERHAEGLTYLD